MVVELMACISQSASIFTQHYHSQRVITLAIIVNTIVIQQYPGISFLKSALLLLNPELVSAPSLFLLPPHHDVSS